MFTITSTRIVGLIAVVCAAIVAPQALATPKVVAPPDVEARQEQSNASAVTAAGLRTSITAGSTAAAIKALQRRSVDLDAVYRKLYPGAYTQAAQKSDKAEVWSFPSCSPSVAVEHDSYIYSGDPCRI